MPTGGKWICLNYFIILFMVKPGDETCACPHHPEHSIPAPAPHCAAKCPDCDFILCSGCHHWHSMDTECHGTESNEDEGKLYKKCPHCQCPTAKEGGCSRMTCRRCGGHWCWECQKGFPTAPDVYAHIKAEHTPPPATPPQ